MSTTLFFDITQDIVKYLDDNWANPDSVPILYENEDHSQHDITNGFVRITVEMPKSNNVTINGYNPRVRTIGMAVVDVYTDHNAGPGKGLNYISQIASVFRNKSFSGILMRAPDVLGSREDIFNKSRYWKISLLCPFQHDINISIA